MPSYFNPRPSPHAGQRLRFTAIALAASLLAACGGGGSPDSASSEITAISGVLIDGPLQGASVFLDLNDNHVQDTGEPASLPTTASGAFTIVAQRLTTAQLATATLVSHVPATARDSYDHGLSLQAAGRRGFTLVSPLSAYMSNPAAGTTAAVVSPLTTLVAGEVADNGLTLAQAKAAVQAQLALGSKDPMADFVAARDSDVGSIARAAAIALGEAGRSIADVAQQEGGIAVREQVAATIKTVKAQLPGVIADLNLNAPGGTPPAVTTLIAKLAEPANAALLTEAIKEPRQAAGTFHDYVVVFHANVTDPAAEAQTLMAGRGGQVRFTYTSAVKGFAVTLPEAAAEAFLDAMARNPNVDYVEVDKPVSGSQTTQSNATWSLDRSDQRDLPLSGSYSYAGNGAGVRAYVIDSGIRSTHTDFGGRVLPGYSVISDGYGTADCNGHGTHVAGSLGATTWGVAKGVSLVPVRVLACDGSGTLSGVIAGIDWVAANAVKPALINMSLGGGASSTLDSAVANTVAKGIPVVVAAGNSSANACNYSPAREPSALTIAATTSADARASFSNFGTCVDLFAPGNSIASTWYSSDTATATASGTSMASPHVAGLVAQILQGTPGATPAQVADQVKAAATTGKVTDAGSGSPNLLLYTTTSSSSPPPPSTSLTVSVGSLTGSGSLVRNGWRAKVTIAVKDGSGAAVPGAAVSGAFTVGGSSVGCTTATNGQCSLSSGNISKLTTETTFSVRGISGTGMTYDAAQNAAGSVTIRRP